jgi:hypothetical protein
MRRRFLAGPASFGFGRPLRLSFRQIEESAAIATLLHIVAERQRPKDGHRNLQMTRATDFVAYNGYGFLLSHAESIKGSEKRFRNPGSQRFDLLQAILRGLPASGLELLQSQ